MSRFSDLIADHARPLCVNAPSRRPRPAVSQPIPRRVKLAANESPYGPSPKAVAAMRAAAEGCHLYPDDDALELRRNIAERHGVEADQVLVSAGLTALLATIARTLLQSGRNAVTSERSFVVYRHVTSATGAKLVETRGREDGYDLDAIFSAIDTSTRLVFFANPNNPTGTMVESGAVERFLERVPPHVVVVIDEAYYDYAQHFANSRGVQYSSPDFVRHENVVLLRTFSKAHGLAGVRVGYGVGPVELIAYLARMQDMFSVSNVAQAAALAALEDEEHIRFAVERNAQQAEWLAGEISKLGYRVIPTWTNFLCCDVGQDASAIARRLREQGLIILPLGQWGAPTSIRITVGIPEQNQSFLDALRKISV